MKITGIYKITNMVDGKIYIGQTVNYNKRMQSHLSSLRRNMHFNEHLQRAFNKYGEKSFKIELIRECNIGELDNLERYYIKTLDVCNHDKGYNMMYGGQKYRNFTKEVRLKMSKSGKGRIFTEEHKKNISLAQRGKIIPQESIDKAAATRRSHKVNCGSKNPNAAISDEMAENIIKDLMKDIPVLDIADTHGISNTVVYSLMYNKTYTYIMPGVREKLKSRTIKLQEDKIKLAIEMYLSGYSQNKIAKILHISRNTLRKELKSRGIDTSKNIGQVNTEVINQIA